MELAGRVFDVITMRDHVLPTVAELIPEIVDRNKLPYWRQALRMAALCHDIGHLPFSHAAEKELLPEGWNHERLTRELILNSPLREIFEQMTPPLRPLDVVKLAVGKKKAPDLQFSTWETILAEIIVGDGFGVDRIDYLLRDSHHSGVAYGRFDHYRLIDTLRVLPDAPAEKDHPNTGAPVLGIDAGGLHSAEALMLARFFMYTQVYFHHVRRIYNIHLKDFLQSWLPGGRFPTDLRQHLQITDNEATAAMRCDSPGVSDTGGGVVYAADAGAWSAGNRASNWLGDW
jgi:HD superfamily phosphohydrolase